MLKRSINKPTNKQRNKEILNTPRVNFMVVGV